jgi:hypothetical protein
MYYEVIKESFSCCFSKLILGWDGLGISYNRMKLLNNILYRITTIEDEERQQLVLPAAHIPTVLQALHDDMGHPGKFCIKCC